MIFRSKETAPPPAVAAIEFEVTRNLLGALKFGTHSPILLGGIR